MKEDKKIPDFDVIEGNLWFRGQGPKDAQCVVLLPRPTEEETNRKTAYTSEAVTTLKKWLYSVNIDPGTFYFTYAVKYSVPGDKNPGVREINEGREVLIAELATLKPKMILSIGAVPLKVLLGNKQAMFSSMRGSEQRSDTFADIPIWPVHSPTYLNHNPGARNMLLRDMEEFAKAYFGETTPVPETHSTVIYEVSKVAELAKYLEESHNDYIVLDTEWNGRTWMDPNRYIRTVQIGYDGNRAAIIAVTGVGGEPIIDDQEELWKVLKRLLEHSRLGIVGHNIYADAHWLMSYGIDITKKVVWDTMLMEFLLNETGPWNLEDLVVKYTDFGRYSLALDTWVKENGARAQLGYGEIPEDILYKYGAIDVIAPITIMEKQIGLLPDDVYDPRGVNKEYPSLVASTYNTQRILFEIERTGMKVDRERLETLISQYQSARADLLARLQLMASNVGVEDFNPASVQQAQRLLFDVLGLQPLKTTSGDNWSEAISNRGVDEPVDVAPSTDQTTLEILADEHPIVYTLLQFRKVDQVCKTWMRHATEEDNETTKGGGIPSKIWPDGRIHAQFSPLAETGRFRTSKPNVQNWPKRAEGAMIEVFGGKDKMPQPIRSIIVPDDGHVLMEADYSQAELFVLAALSGDDNMMSALTTPGKDLHDTTSVTSFNLTVLDPSDEIVTDDLLIALAGHYGEDSDEFSSFLKSLRYLDQKGIVMSRDEFKETARVSGKSVNFGCARSAYMVFYNQP